MRSVIVLISLFPLACATTPSGPPEEVALSIIEDLDADRTGKADDRFDRVSDDKSYREKIYPILYGTAGDRYQQGDPAGAQRILRFMAPRYADGTAVQEALLYSLFLERAQLGESDKELTKEIDAVLDDVRDSEAGVPIWVDLVASQQAIDRGELGEAREALSSFLDRWDGQPSELFIYVEDMERYLRTH